MHEYYATKHIQPTFADFDEAGLANYEDMRKRVFNRLKFPAEMFYGKQVLEFGPDTGENSLVFAQWGANMTLVEPNPNALTYIHQNFSKFGMTPDTVVESTLMEFQSSEKFDIIDAEGFIYTIQPSDMWFRKLGGLLKKDGFLIITYLEKNGSLIELLTKAIWENASRENAEFNMFDGLGDAKRLFEKKWNSIPHTRTFESWFMDVIENPYVSLKYMIDPIDLLKDAYANGFRLYSSWPAYNDSSRWIKSPFGKDAELNDSIGFIERTTATDYDEMKVTLAVLDLMANGGDLMNYCNTDPTFLKTWGNPNHYAIFQKI